MSDMKCPICGNDLEHYHTGLVCYRHCLNGKNVWGSEETLKELDRTRKALDVAVDGLLAVWRATDCTTKQGSIAYNVLRDLNIKPLDRIKALEQADHFAGVSKMVEQKDVK